MGDRPLSPLLLHSCIIPQKERRSSFRERARKKRGNQFAKAFLELSLSRSAKTNRKVELDGDDVDDDRPVRRRCTSGGRRSGVDRLNPSINRGLDS